MFPKKINFFLPALVLTSLILPFRALAIENLLSCGNVRECILNAINNLLYVVVGVTVVVMIIAGIMYIFSGANESFATRAKSAFLGACLGFTIVIGAQILISQVGCALGWKDATDCQGAQKVITRAINFLFSILGAVGIGGILIGAIYYFASAGDPGQAEKGKKIVVYSIIGTVIALSAALIVGQVEKFFV